MNQTTTVEAPNEISELQAGITEYLAEIDRLREQMSRDDAAIERSRKHTRAMLAEIRATLSLMGPKAA